jgi:hypothetical protein
MAPDQSRFFRTPPVLREPRFRDYYFNTNILLSITTMALAGVSNGQNCFQLVDGPLSEVSDHANDTLYHGAQCFAPGKMKYASKL